jgi:hypothetical protein
MMAFAAMAFAGDAPEFGLFESSSEQYRDAGAGFKPMDSRVTFRVLYIPDNSYVGLVWDYDGDGLADEDVETYEHEMTAEGLVWREGELVYAMYESDGEHWVLMMFPDGDTFAIRMEQLDTVEPGGSAL